MTAPPAWMEKGYATIEKYGTANSANLSGVLDRSSLDISIGDKAMESIPTLNLARVYKYDPEGDSEISFDLYLKDMGTSSGGIDLFFIDTTVYTSGKIDVVHSQTREKMRLTILFTNDPVPSTATTTVNATTTLAYAARRYIFADAYITSYKTSFTDGILKVSVTMKVPPYDGSATANIGYQSLDGSTSSSLAALGSYTATTKW